MFGFLKKCFFTAMTFFGCNVLRCVLVNNHNCKIRSEIIDVSNNEPTFYPFSIEVNKLVEAATILMILMQNYVFLMLLKT